MVRRSITLTTSSTLVTELSEVRLLRGLRGGELDWRSCLAEDRDAFARILDNANMYPSSQEMQVWFSLIENLVEKRRRVAP